MSKAPKPRVKAPKKAAVGDVVTIKTTISHRMESGQRKGKDGNLIPRGIAIPAQSVIKGDGRSVSIAAASIVAKIRRDYVMRDLAQHFPGYGWESNAGYPTKSHKEALENLGVTPHHRRSFKPVHNILYQEK